MRFNQFSYLSLPRDTILYELKSMDLIFHLSQQIKDIESFF